MASDSLTLDIVPYFFFATYGASIQDLNSDAFPTQPQRNTGPSQPRFEVKMLKVP